MTQRGYYLMHRGAMGHPVFGAEPFTRYQAWEWMISEASWDDRETSYGFEAVTLRRGQLLKSVRVLAKEWKWDSSKVFRFISRLEREKMIETDTESGMKRITICNYDIYQPERNTGETPIETPIETPAKQRRNTGETTHKNSKHSMNLEENQHPSDVRPPAAGKPLPAEAEEWNAMAAECGLSKIQIMTDARKRALRKRLAECGGIEGWRAAMAKIRGSPFLLGTGGKSWRADFDFVLQAKSFTKLMEGAYDPPSNRGGKAQLADRFAALSEHIESLSGRA